MISAQVDQIVQDQLIEKYMMLPNQVWDDIITSAAKVGMKAKYRVFFTTYFYTLVIFRHSFRIECRHFEKSGSSETIGEYIENERKRVSIARSPIRNTTRSHVSRYAKRV